MTRLVVGLVGAVLLTGCSAPSPEAAPSSTPPAPAAPTVPEPTRPTITESLTTAEQDALDRRLIDAAWANDLASARRLIARGADVNTEDETQQSAFLIATSEGYSRLLELTLRHGADLDAKDSYDGTGLIRAAERGHSDVVRRLIQAGIELDHVNNLGWTALHEAVILGDGSQRYVETVRVLVAVGADVTIPTERDGLTALQHANAKGHDEVARILRRG